VPPIKRRPIESLDLPAIVGCLLEPALFPNPSEPSRRLAKLRVLNAVPTAISTGEAGLVVPIPTLPLASSITNLTLLFKVAELAIIYLSSLSIPTDQVVCGLTY
jgi:hypothetical protein